MSLRSEPRLDIGTVIHDSPADSQPRRPDAEPAPSFERRNAALQARGYVSRQEDFVVPIAHCAAPQMCGAGRECADPPASAGGCKMLLDKAQRQSKSKISI